MRILSGIQPSGVAHLGNYLGYIKQNIDLLGEEENFLMIADLHALTTVYDPDELRGYREELAKDFLACGFDSSKGTLFCQSDIPEHTELAWILSCVTPMGLLERAVSFKEKVQQGIDSNVGLFSYPVLQAADIVIYDADLVPIGKDQKQHIEMARDIAQKFNNRYGKDTLVLPEPRIKDEVAIVPGIDGKKMSKSYGNTLPLFEDEKKLKKIIMSIVTDSKEANDPKDPDSCIIYQIHKLLLGDSEAKALVEEYKNGLPYGDAKTKLFEAYMDFFGPMRQKREKLTNKDADDVLVEGAKKASGVAKGTMERVRKAVGLR